MFDRTTTNEKCSHCNSTFERLFLLTARVFGFALCKFYFTGFYALKQLLLSERLSHRNSVCLSVRLSVCLSVRHTGGSVKNGAS